MHYYYQKYPFLHYDYTDYDGNYVMFSVPPELLATAFFQHFGVSPKTFFDCGAATGEIVYTAERMGMRATGIDIKKYPYQSENLNKLFQQGKIQIKSILDCGQIRTDLVYCNGVLTYFQERDLLRVLGKFNKCKMLIAIHNTTEDVTAAAKQGNVLVTCNKPRLIRPKDWWIKTFLECGFDSEYDNKTQCFYACPRTR